MADSEFRQGEEADVSITALLASFLLFSSPEGIWLAVAAAIAAKQNENCS
jgi:hypothetical protein